MQPGVHDSELQSYPKTGTVEIMPYNRLKRKNINNFAYGLNVFPLLFLIIIVVPSDLSAILSIIMDNQCVRLRSRGGAQPICAAKGKADNLIAFALMVCFCGDFDLDSGGAN